MPKRGMRGAVAREALDELPRGKQEERQDDPLGLSRVERALERRLRRAPIAELLASQSVEHMRLRRRGWPMDHQSRTIDHTGEHINGVAGLTFGEVNNGGGQAHIAGVAVCSLISASVARAAARRPMYTWVWSSRA